MSSGSSSSSRPSFFGAERSQSEVLGIVLLLSITIAGSTAIMAMGTTVLTDAQQNAGNSNAEHTMTQLDSEASLVALGSSDAQEIGVSEGTRGTTVVYPDAGRVNVTLVNESTGDLQEVIIDDAALGSVVHEQDDTTIAYQGGGVWSKKESGNASAMISPPEFHHRADSNGQSPTLTMPLVLVEGDRVSGDRVRMTANGVEDRFPVDGGAKSNPLMDSVVNITVESEYYQAWGRFFEERTDGRLEAVDHENQTVTIQLVMVADRDDVKGALASTSTDGDLSIAGNGAKTDSYNSSNTTRFPDGYNEANATNDGTIETGGDVDIGGGAEVEGDIRSGGTVDMGGRSSVNGHIFWTDGFSARGASSYEGESSIDGVEGSEDITQIVVRTVDEASEANDNDEETDDITADELDFDGGAELDGTDDPTYYLERLEVPDGETLTVDTTNGNVTVAVEEYVDVKGTIDVQGSNQTKIYAKGDDTANGQDHVYFGGGEVDVTRDRSSQFWVYGTADMHTTIDKNGGESRFVGVIYAPAGNDGSGSVTVENNAGALLGGAVTGSTTINQGGRIHYDQALVGQTPIEEGMSIPRVTYLHISVSRMNVTTV